MLMLVDLLRLGTLESPFLLSGLAQQLGHPFPAELKNKYLHLPYSNSDLNRITLYMHMCMCVGL